MAGAGKICIVCGEDCADRPRIKDGRGRYACKACVEAKRGSGAAGVVGDVDDGDGLVPLEPAIAGGEAEGVEDDDLLALESFSEPAASAPVEGRACPNCGVAVLPEAVICLECGTNLGDGKALKTRVMKADKEPRDGGGLRVAVSPGAGAWIGAGLFVGLGVLGFGMKEPMFLYVYLGLWVVFSLATWIWSIVAAFQDREVGWGVTLIVAPFICIGGLLNLWYVFKESGRDNLQACYSVALVAGAGIWLFDKFDGYSTMAGRPPGWSGFDNGAMVEPDSVAPDPHPAAVRLSYEDEDPADVESALVQLCDEVMWVRIDDDPSHPDRREYRRLMAEGMYLSEYPDDVVAEAVEWFELLEEWERDDLMLEGLLPEP